jgi:glycosyltransferase involved in cell wall biosynthesis
MKIGLYVNSLSPKGAAQARFQSAIFEGLLKHNTARHQFVVLAEAVPDGLKNMPNLEQVSLQKNPARARLLKVGERHLCHFGSKVCKHLGKRWLKMSERLWKRAHPEPAYYRQLRELDIRLIWYVNGHELPSWLPFIKTVWDVNHRIHSMYPEFSYTRFKFDGLDQPLSMTKASYLIVGTEEGKRQLTSMFGVYEPKIRVIPFPTPILPESGGVKAELNLGFKHTAPYLFFPARFWPHKNHVVAVAALRVLRERWNIILNLVFSGVDEGNLSHVLNYAEVIGVRDQVRYVGSVSEVELANLYRNALALTFVAAVGPDNLPPLEAMALQCPVIVADVPGAREQFGDACLFFETYDEVSLASQIIRLLDESQLRESLIEKGLRRARQWSTEDYAAEVVKIFDEFESIARSWANNSVLFS